MKTHSLIWLLIGLSPAAHAGFGAHGGDVLRLDGKHYLLDLVEAGVEKDPYFKKDVPTHPQIQVLIESSLNQAPVSKNLLLSKLSEIAQVNELLAVTLALGIRELEWRFIPRALTNVPDEDSSIDYDPEDLLQIAVRRSRFITVDSNLWAKLTREHQIALILHETIYALIKPNDDGPKLKLQSSAKARQINGYLFTQDYDTRGAEYLNRILNGNLPTPITPKTRAKWVGKEILHTPFICVMGGYTWDSCNFIDLDLSGNELETRIDKICESLIPSGVRKIYGLLTREGELNLSFQSFSSKTGPRDYLAWNDSPTAKSLHGESLVSETAQDCARDLLPKIRELQKVLEQAYPRSN